MKIKGIVMHHSSKLSREQKAHVSYLIDKTKLFFEKIQCDDFNQIIEEILNNLEF